MTTTHTPAPWKIGPNDRGDGLSVIATTPRGTAIAVCYGTGRLDNARLISAAPDMLTALEQLAGFLERTAMFFEESCMPGNAGNCTIKAKEARAAIAKARGDA
jgi:hypothetical protein